MVFQGVMGIFGYRFSLDFSTGYEPKATAVNLSTT
jgi:hypothetical protein